MFRGTKRNAKGQGMAEFGPAMMVFVCFVLMPLVDMAFIPARYFIACSMVSETAHRLALCEKRSDTQEVLNDGWWQGFVERCGVKVTPKPVKLHVFANNGDKVTVLPGEEVPNQFLPNGSKAPCVYTLELTVDAEIPPLVHGSAGLPGFTSPLHMTISGKSNWENFGRDPETKKYFMNL